MQLVSGLEPGTIFADIEKLEQVLSEARQRLLNRRVFDAIDVRWEAVPREAVRTEVDGGPAPGGSAPVPVQAVFTVDDGWTLLPVPFYRYDSNSGHNPLVVIFWDNIAGTLTNFAFSAGYYSRNWTTPFAWDVKVKWKNIRLLGREWDFSIAQDFTTEELADPDGTLELAYSGNRTKASFSTGFRLGPDLRYSISPQASAEYGFAAITNTIDADIPADTLGIGFSHSVGGGTVDWRDSFRDGSRWGVSHSMSISPETGNLSSDASVSAAVFGLYGIPRPNGRRDLLFNPAIQGKVVHGFNGDRLSLGGAVRGVANNRIYGQTGLFVQTQYTVRLLDLRSVAELHFSPFLDAAVVKKEHQRLDSDDISAGVGFDITVFPDFIRGFQGRLSFGIDARHPSSMELVIVETLAY